LKISGERAQFQACFKIETIFPANHYSTTVVKRRFIIETSFIIETFYRESAGQTHREKAWGVDQAQASNSSMN
jgi:hypothetical protein